MDRFFASRVSSSSNAAQPARQLSSIDDVQRWLTTLTELSSTQNFESLLAAVNVLRTPNPRHEDVRPLIKIWSVQWSIRKKERPLPDIVRDLREKVIKAGNEFRANLEQHAQIATDNAAQPADPPQQKKKEQHAQIATDSAAQPAEPPQQKKRNLGPDSEPKQPTAKAKPTTRQQKRKQDSPALVAEASDTSTAAQPAFPQSKTQRLTHFGFECRSGPVIAPEADVVEQDAATDTPENSKNLALRLVRLTSRRLAIKAVPRQM